MTAALEICCHKKRSSYLAGELHRNHFERVDIPCEHKCATQVLENINANGWDELWGRRFSITSPRGEVQDFTQTHGSPTPRWSEVGYDYVTVFQ